MKTGRAAGGQAERPHGLAVGDRHERRVRHAPVVVDDSLHGTVSIGDVVKIRIGELENERAALTDYIIGTR